MPRTLRFQGETDAQFRLRVERAGRVARVLVDACLANVWVQDLIADDELDFYTVDSFRRDPVVRIDYDEAFAIATIGEGLAMTKSKARGDGPRILPLKPNHYVDDMFIGYVYKPASRYNRRFEQGPQLKRMLGRDYRRLVDQTKKFTKTIFLRDLTSAEAQVIRNRINVKPGVFWRAAKGRVYLDLPKPPVQLELFEL